MPQEDFRSFVLAWLERSGWTQARLSEVSEVPGSLISKHLIKDERRRVVPSPKNLEKYAPVLHVPYEDLMRLCGYLPGKADLTQPASAIESDIHARTAELLGAVKGAPPVFWESMIRALFDQATISARTMAELLRSAEGAGSRPIASRTARDRAPGNTGTQGKSRRKPNIKLRHAELALAC